MIFKSAHVLKTKSFSQWTILLTLILWTCAYYSLTVIKEYSSQRRSFIMQDYQNPGYLVKTPGCLIPEMYVNDSEINSFMKYDDVLDCKSEWKYTSSLVTSNLTALILNFSALAALKIDVDDPQFECYYTAIDCIPISNDPDTHDQNESNTFTPTIVVGERTYFRDDVTVPDEMVEVTCTFRTLTVYVDYHVFVRPTPSVKIRSDGAVSVLILGLDGVSRLNFHRHMPKASAFLSALGNVELLGYNKVEDNTFPNLIPALTGLSVDELKKRCWRDKDDFFDDCYFVWDDFRNANFDTVFMEDSTFIGLFHYLRKGFLNKPVDHYLRPIMVQAENMIGHQERNNIKCCIGTQLGMTTLFNYAHKVASSMADRKYFGFFWSSSLTHDFVEYPRFGDDDLTAIIDKFNRSGELNKTVLILMSDHGMRWGVYRSTYQGGLEDRLPMLRLLVPEWFEAAYPKAVRNLNGNVNRLTTTYDLHETLLDLVDVRRLTDESIEARTRAAADTTSRGSSLFLEISEQKTCQTAGIPKHYCACQVRKTMLTVDEPYVVKAANYFTDYINAMLKDYPLCANLSLHGIQSAVVESDGDMAWRVDAIRNYELQVTTLPGKAKFEAMVRRTGEQFDVLGNSFSRLNAYSNQSVCVNDPIIKLLCYCVR